MNTQRSNSIYTTHIYHEVSLVEKKYTYVCIRKEFHVAFPLARKSSQKYKYIKLILLFYIGVYD